MNTVFDWLTLAAFAGLAILYLQRSMLADPGDRIVHYLPPAAACAGANWLGNHDHPLLALAVLAAGAAWVWRVLRPGPFSRH